jgi:hypothetical protein
VDHLRLGDLDLNEYQRHILRERPALYLPLNDDGERAWVNGHRTFGVRGFLNRLLRRIPR